MSISDEYKRLPLTEIVVKEGRQRTGEIKIDDLIPSIRRWGVLQPIVIERDGTLIFGERRFRTCEHLALPDIPVRYADELTEIERRLLEFDENAKRSDLSWQDMARAIEQIHTLHLEIDPEWNKEKTAADRGFSVRRIEFYLDLAEALKGGDKAIVSAETAASAHTILSRRRQRNADEAVNRIMDFDQKIAPPSAEDQAHEAETLPAVDLTDLDTKQEVPKQTSRPFSIIAYDLKDFFSSRPAGSMKYNLLHLDLPYGVELHGQAQQDSFEGGGYDSNPDIYWDLLRAIAAGWEDVMYPSSHVMCWISMEFYTETFAFFEKHIPRVKLQRTPLIWHKTDGKGIMPDAKRQGRRIYEACLFGACDDRYIVKPVNNCYGAPTDKANAIHTNEKPVPMLKNFLSMFVDEHTRILDPTCGSGSAIRAAEALGAERGLGLELNADFVKRAQERLQYDIGIRNLAEKVNP